MVVRNVQKIQKVLHCMDFLVKSEIHNVPKYVFIKRFTCAMMVRTRIASDYLQMAIDEQMTAK